MPAPPLQNNLEGGTSGSQVLTTDTGSGDPFTASQTVAGGVPTYDSTFARGKLSCRVREPGAGMGPISVALGGFGSLTVDVFFRAYQYVSAWTAGLFLVMGQGYTAALANCAAIGFNPADGRLVIFDGSGAATIAGAVALPASRWLRLEWRIKPSATVGEIEYRAYDGDSVVPLDSTLTTGLVLGANIDRMDFGNLGSSEANYTNWLDDFAVSAVDWIGPSGLASFIASWGRRPVPMIKGPDIDRIMGMQT